MEVLACGHVAHRGSSQMCVHLLAESNNGETIALLTGVGLDHDLCCPACDTLRTDGEPIELLDSCEGCVARVDDDPWNPTAWRGEAGLRYRSEPVDTTLRRTPLPDSLHEPLDIIPLENRSGSWWLVLTRDLQLVALDGDGGAADVLVLVRLAPEPAPSSGGPGMRPRLHSSADGRFVAVVHDRGRYAVVADLESGLATMDLDRGDSHAEQTSFPLTFWRHDDRTLVIHATAWNRLDVSDPADGALLTPRGPTTYDATVRPEHYLDYFHGALHLSPDQRWLVDDGWVWQPVGIPMVFDVHRWMDENVWEAEDGPSLRQLAFRGYLWDQPMCWIGSGLLAISGIGSDSQAMIDGAIVLDPDTGTEVCRFAGPSGRFFGEQERLFSVGVDGLAIWDPLTGSQTGMIPGFRPVAHHRGAHELAEIVDGTLVRWAVTTCASAPGPAPG